MTRASSVRLDIQALRAIAVASVVIYHVWPAALPGGFIGVDVFFVVSGFLISQHLMREHASTGTIQLGRFWARRARRLLPAAFTVLAFTTIAAWVWLPATRLAGLPRHVAAAALYVENWLLAANSVDYLAAEAPPGPVQHFWSLSVEEQFYLVWPVLIVVVGLLVRHHSRKAIAATMLTLVVGSFAYSLWLTDHDPARAFFVTPTRAWEFGAGALLALAPQLRAGPHVRAAILWCGAAMIVVSCFIITGSTPFPGVAALFPVVGSILFIGAEANTARYSPLFIGRLRPVQRLGDISYSVYLWHWPILVILPFIVTGLTPWLLGTLVVLLTIGISEASYRWIETPTRTAPRIVQQPTWRVLTAALVGSFVVIAFTVPIHRSVVMETAAARDSLKFVAMQPGCVGAGGDMACLAGTDIVVVPDPQVDLDHGTTVCQQTLMDPAVKICEEGVAVADATRTVALIGDSHARQWAPALIEVAKARNWHLVFILKAGCPFTNAQRGVHKTNETSSCTVWNKTVQTYLDDHPQISVVLTSASSNNTYSPLPDTEIADEDNAAAVAAKEKFPASRGISVAALSAGIAGARDASADVPQTVTKIIAIRDVARPREDLEHCLQIATDAQLRQSAPECSLSAREAMLPDPLAAAAALAESRVVVVDLTDEICTAAECAVIVNAASVYRDAHHMTTIFSFSLADEFDAAIVGAGF